MTPKARPAITEFSTETAASSVSPTKPAKVCVSAPREYWQMAVKIAGPASFHSFLDSAQNFLGKLTGFSTSSSLWLLRSGVSMAIVALWNHFHDYTSTALLASICLIHIAYYVSKKGELGVWSHQWFLSDQVGISWADPGSFEGLVWRIVTWEWGVTFKGLAETRGWRYVTRLTPFPFPGIIK